LAPRRAARRLVCGVGWSAATNPAGLAVEDPELTIAARMRLEEPLADDTRLPVETATTDRSFCTGITAAAAVLARDSMAVTKTVFTVVARRFEITFCMPFPVKISVLRMSISDRG
jgi:hypothetical protein